MSEERNENQSVQTASVTKSSVESADTNTNNENIKVLRSFENKSVDLNQVYTPVAYAADLDDDQNDTGVRKNVDGSVTVVRAFPMDK